MRVILTKNTKGLGRIGDIKEVTEGYARNFLIPRNIAVLASESNIKKTQKANEQAALYDLKNKTDAQKALESLGNLALKFTEEANTDGHLYGSVDEKKIATMISKYNIQIEPTNVIMQEPIKNTGAHTVILRFHPEVSHSIQIEIEAKK